MKKKYSLKTVIALMLVASALTWSAFVIIIGYPFGAFSGRADRVRDFAALLMRIDELFIGEYDDAEISDAAMRATVDALDDNWSFYMPPEEYKQHLDSIGNRYDGIGITVASDGETGAFRVVQVFSDSAAETAGLIPGDLIIAVDGASVAGLTTDELRIMLFRPIGDTAELSVERADVGTLFLTVAYSVVFIDPVSYEMLDGSIGYVDISNFNEGTSGSFVSAVENLLEQGASALIFDVRGNPGGFVTEVTGMLDYLLPEGEIFVMVDRNGNETITMSGPEEIDVPAVVLVDRFSFSAAEYFAAILSEYGRAEIVGEQTTGKSRMQKTVVLPGGGALHISFAQYLTKNRVSLHDTGGILPDHQAVLTDDELALYFSGSLEKEHDPQLQKAISVLQT